MYTKLKSNFYNFFLKTTVGTKIVENVNCRAYKGLRLLFQALPYTVLRIF
jgi:hypothetical protein